MAKNITTQTCTNLVFKYYPNLRSADVKKVLPGKCNVIVGVQWVTNVSEINTHTDTTTSRVRDSLRMNLLQERNPDQFYYGVADLHGHTMECPHSRFIDKIIDSAGNWGNTIEYAANIIEVDHVRMPEAYIRPIIVSFANGGLIQLISRGVIDESTQIFLPFFAGLTEIYSKIVGFKKVDVEDVNRKVISQFPLVPASEAPFFSITAEFDNPEVSVNHLNSEFYIAGNHRYIKLMKDPAYQPFSSARERATILNEESDDDDEDE